MPRSKPSMAAPAASPVRLFPTRKIRRQPRARSSWIVNRSWCRTRCKRSICTARCGWTPRSSRIFSSRRKKSKMLRPTAIRPPPMPSAVSPLIGLTKEITVPVKLTYLKDKLGQRVPKMEGDLLVIRSTFAIKRSDYGINPGQIRGQGFRHDRTHLEHRRCDHRNRSLSGCEIYNVAENAQRVGDNLPAACHFLQASSLCAVHMTYQNGGHLITFSGGLTPKWNPVSS